MNDLTAWLRLHADLPAAAPRAAAPAAAESSGDVSSLIAALSAAADLAPAQRWPYFAAIAAVARHPDARVRAAAVMALGGAAGLPAERLILAGLDDGDATVRTAALSALASSAVVDGTLWLHAVVHPDPTLRAHAAAHAPAQLSWLWLRLLADSACRPVVASRLSTAGVAPATAPALLAHHAAGHLDAALMLQLVAALPWRSAMREIIDAFEQGAPALPKLTLDVHGLWDLREAMTAHAFGAAALVDVLMALGRTDPAGLDEAVIQPLLERGRTGSLPGDAEKRLALAILGWLGRNRDAAPVPGLLALCALVMPEVLRLRELDRDVVRQALVLLAGTRRESLRRVRLDPELAVVGGKPDLRALAGLVAVTERGSFAEVGTRLSQPLLVDGLVADPATGVRLLAAVEDDDGSSVLLRTALLVEAARRHGPRSAPLIAGTWARRGEAAVRAVSELDDNTLDALVAALDDLAASGRIRSKRLTRIAKALATRREPAVPFVRHLLLDAGLDGPVTLAVFVEVARATPPAVLVLGLGDLGLIRLAELDRMHGFLPWPVLQGLGGAVKHPPTAEVSTWLAPVGGRVHRRPSKRAMGSARPLSEAESDRIRTCRDRALARAVAPALQAPVTGLVAALASRDDPGTPQPEACAALLVCQDPLESLHAQLLRFGLADPTAQRRIDGLLVEGWATRSSLGFFGAAWLYRWDPPFEAFEQGAVAEGLERLLEASLRWPVAPLRERVWRGVGHLLGRWRWRSGPELETRVPESLPRFVASALSLPAGRHGAGGYFLADQDRDQVRREAARILATLHGGGVDLTALRGLILEALPGLDRLARTSLAKVVSARGVGRRTAPVGDDAPGDAAERIVAARTPDQLLPFCRLSARSLAELAVLRLLELGEAGAQALLTLLLDPSAPHRDLLGESVAHWPEGPTLERARQLVDDDLASASLSAEGRFHLALALHEGQARPGMLDGAIAAVCLDDPDPWLTRSALERLVLAAEGAGLDLALDLATSCQPLACTWAVERLALRTAQPDARGALRRFLCCGQQRPSAVRVQAAHALRGVGDALGLPVLLADRMQRANGRLGDDVARDWACKLPAEAVAEAVDAMMLAGDGLAPGQVVVDGLADPAVAASAVEAGAMAVLRQARSPDVQGLALKLLESRMHQRRAAQRLASLYIWGRDQARRLLSRTFRVAFISGQGLGWTRLEERAIYVNPVPLLSGERDGEAILRGLMVHELGHHLYNADEQGKAIWKKAQQQHLARLHNLVCDEHLERNLRSLDTAYGDDLKRLGAWAFQHAQKGLDVRFLVDRLGTATVAVLADMSLSAARSKGQVTVRTGDLFRSLEASGDSFGRFVRALRMGLGDRHGDPKVAAGLALVDKRFRKLDNAGLWEVTLKLRALFGERVELLDLLDLHGTAEGSEGDRLIEGRGLSDDQVEREVERLDLDKVKGQKRSGRALGGGGKDVVNIGRSVDFDRIHRVVALPFDTAAARELSRDVLRPARKLRGLLQRLGLSTVEVRPRISGHRLDRTRLVALAVRGDPRVLISRRVVHKSDLFLGLVVDCSGSMSGARIERARRFAALVSEACRDLAGVDLRVFGFTDSTIFDVGSAQRCAAHGLVAGGGNNDAAGLWHAAQIAQRSRRTARLLVMVSDGLPTECSTTALSGLVRRLQRRHGMVCAQVAVAPLVEPCFDTYIEVLDDDVNRSVRDFGRVIGGLVARTLKG